MDVFSFYQQYLLVVTTKCLQCQKGITFILFFKKEKDTFSDSLERASPPFSYPNSFFKYYWSKNWNRSKVEI